MVVAVRGEGVAQPGEDPGAVVVVAVVVVTVVTAVVRAVVVVLAGVVVVGVGLRGHGSKLSAQACR